MILADNLAFMAIEVSKVWDSVVDTAVLFFAVFGLVPQPQTKRKQAKAVTIRTRVCCHCNGTTQINKDCEFCGRPFGAYVLSDGIGTTCDDAFEMFSSAFW